MPLITQLSTVTGQCWALSESGDQGNGQSATPSWRLHVPMVIPWICTHQTNAQKIIEISGATVGPPPSPLATPQLRVRLMILVSEQAVAECCSCATFAATVAGRGPYGSVEELIAAARAVWWHQVRAGRHGRWRRQHRWCGGCAVHSLYQPPLLQRRSAGTVCHSVCPRQCDLHNLTHPARCRTSPS